MKKLPLAVQLYSLREQAAKDFVGVLKLVADIGYQAVEPAGFWNLSPKEFKKIIDDLGLKIFSSHSPWARGNNTHEVIDTLGVLGVRYATCGFGPDDFKDLDCIKRTAELVNTMQADFEKAGITLFQHNHSFEFEKLDGRLKYDIYAELAPKVKFQIDAFWSANFGANDPVEMVKRFAPRTVAMHLKDGVFERDESKFVMVNGYLDRKVKMLPLGTGEMDLPAIVKVTPPAVETLIVELDRSEFDMVESIRKSYLYMTSNGLAAGNK